VCNTYEPASLDYLTQEWRSHLSASGSHSLGPFKQRLFPRDNGPFITHDRVLVGQWGLIRKGAPDRVQKNAQGRPISTNNARIESVATKPTYRDAWKNGQRCLIPAVLYLEPYWGTGKNIWWRFARRDTVPWTLAGIWSEWTDPTSGEVVPNYTMLTMNCDAHPLLNQFHKPDPDLPADKQDKRSVVSIEKTHWNTWLTGTIEEALALVRLTETDVFQHGADNPAQYVALAVAAQTSN
jgi:putative SOS response-associated peptidase YedK